MDSTHQKHSPIASTQLTVVIAILSLSNYFLTNCMDNQHVQLHAALEKSNTNRRDAKRLTPLHIAVESYCRIAAEKELTIEKIESLRSAMSMIRELLDQGADRTIRDRNDRTPLDRVQNELNITQSNINDLKTPENDLWMAYMFRHEKQYNSIRHKAKEYDSLSHQREDLKKLERVLKGENERNTRFHGLDDGDGDDYWCC